MPDDSARVAFNKFGLGFRPSTQKRVTNPRQWLKDQTKNTEVPMASSISIPDPYEVAAAYTSLRQARMESNMEMQAEARRKIVVITRQEIQNTLTQRIISTRPFAERLVAFWSNHLCVSIMGGKVILGGFAGAYEREAIRPHVFGTYEDMVLASAKHPAMLVYLDNAQSIGPTSRAGKRIQKRRQQGIEVGLNENYARELLELHTVGVGGGYSQEDVRELSEILTGWGIDRDRLQQNAVGFRFYPALHEPGAKTVLGKRYTASGVKEGEQVIRDLVRHPSTARFISTKLATHFVADSPPEQAINTLEQVFRESKGDLKEVSLALIDLEAAWDPTHRKFKTPQEWLVSIARTLNANESPRLFPTLLTQLRQPVWAPPSPKGYGDRVQDWADPDSLMNRAELARSIAQWAAGQVESEKELSKLSELVDDSHLATFLNDAAISKAERIALVFAAPSFQWR